MKPTVFAAVVLLAGFMTSRVGSIYWQLGLCVLGGTVAISLTALGGAVILPAVLFLPFLVARAWREERGKDFIHRVPEPAVWLMLTVLFGVVTAFTVPRLLAGMVQVVGVDRTAVQQVPLSPLHPVSGNITQSGYAIGNVLTFVAMRSMLNSPSRVLHFRKAVLLLCALDASAGVLNLAEFYLHLPSLLQYVRTAYAVFGDYEVAGLVRIHGTFSETSAFCGFTLPLFAFCLSLWMQKVEIMRSGLLTLVLLAFLLVSTSSTAYGGLAVYGVVFGLSLLYRAYLRGWLPRAEWLVVLVLGAVVFLGLNFLFETSFAKKLTSFFEVTAFSKLESKSGVERQMWNRQAWNNFIDTYGIGVGLGTVRCSSLPMVLLSNIGAIGTLFYVFFLKAVLAKPASGADADPTTIAARQAVIMCLCAASIGQPMFDMGIAFYCFAAAASLAPKSSRVQVALQHAETNIHYA
ncbi:MAG TPA: hypothetical protein VI299_30065 [Polyangiales bacterium]